MVKSIKERQGAEMRQKIDGYAQRYLKEVAHYFLPHFGEMNAVGDELIFDTPPRPLSCVRMLGKKNKQLFGGVYSLQIIGELEQPRLQADRRPIRIFYEGWMVKGKAYFKQGSAEEPEIVKRLNSNAELIRALSRLDLEFGAIIAADGKYLVELTPLSGSYMYMTIPPLRYPGAISQQEVTGLALVMRQMSQILKAG
jgi:hypothetical protein